MNATEHRELFGQRPEQPGNAQWIYDCAHLARTLSRLSVRYAAMGNAREAERCRKDATLYLRSARRTADFEKFSAKFTEA